MCGARRLARFSVTLAVIAAAASVAGPAPPPGPVPPVVPEAIESLLLGEGVGAETLRKAYDALTQGLGSGIRDMKKYGLPELQTRGYTPEFAKLSGQILARNRTFQIDLCPRLTDLWKQTDGLAGAAREARFLSLLSDGKNFGELLKNTLGADRIQTIAQATEKAWHEALGAGAGGAAAGGAAAAGAEAPAGMMARFLNALERLRELLFGASGAKTMTSLFGFMVVAGVTEAVIDACLTAYVEEMEDIGEAADREAYNDLVRTLLDHLADGSLELPEGMTLPEALRRLRKNLTTWPFKPYDGLIVKGKGALEDETHPSGGDSQSFMEGDSAALDARFKPELESSDGLFFSASTGPLPEGSALRGMDIQIHPRTGGVPLEESLASFTGEAAEEIAALNERIHGTKEPQWQQVIVSDSERFAYRCVPGSNPFTGQKWVSVFFSGRCWYRGHLIIAGFDEENADGSVSDAKATWAALLGRAKALLDKRFPG